MKTRILKIQIFAISAFFLYSQSLIHGVLLTNQKNLEEIKKSKRPVVHKVTENVYAITDLFHSKGQLAGVNAGIIFTSNSVVFIDSGMTVDSGEFLWKTAKKRMKAHNQLYLLLTHEHSDHTFGMRAMKDRGARIIAHKIVGEEFKDDNGEYKQFIMDMDKLSKEEGDSIFGDVVLSVPDETVEEDTILNIDGQEIHLLITPGHTPDCVCIYHPRSKTLFAGDTIYENLSPATKFGGPTEWKQWVFQLERLIQLDIEIIVPGHGNLCGKEVIDRNITHLEEMIRNEPVILELI
jgi:glyoxylase-like metal-dependent hydrolase (beta-lactamase superfamily II)